jgi:hypothetical protein
MNYKVAKGDEGAAHCFNPGLHRKMSKQKGRSHDGQAPRSYQELLLLVI